VNVEDAKAHIEFEAPAPEYDSSGVDVSLIRWRLSLTPAERLEVLEDRVNDILSIRERNAKS
jgi:hypothetical protein